MKIKRNSYLNEKKIHRKLCGDICFIFQNILAKNMQFT